MDTQSTTHNIKIRKPAKQKSTLDRAIMKDMFMRYYPDADAHDVSVYVDFVYDKKVTTPTIDYLEKHHCIPVSLDDEYEESSFNLFSLKYVDHISAHYLFWKAVGAHDDGVAKKSLGAVSFTNNNRGFYHPSAFAKYLVDVTNNRAVERPFELVYERKHGLDTDTDFSEFTDAFGILVATESELIAIDDGDADVINAVRARVSERDQMITEASEKIHAESDIDRTYALDTSFHDFELITNEYQAPIDLADVELPYRYKPYPFQSEILDEFFDMLECNSTRKRFALELHRRAGKDVTFFQLVTAAACVSVGDYAYMLPTHTQAKKVIWNGTVNDEFGNPCKFHDFIPPMMNPVAKVSDNRIELSNGSNIYVIGSDNYDSLVGMNLKGVVFSEWSLCNPLSYDYLAPMLRRNAKLDPLSGWALFCWTPRGRNHAYKTRQIATMEKNKNLWFFMSKTIEDTTDHNGNRLISDADIQEELDSGADPDKIKQEYYLDYDAAVKGIIYAKQMEIVRREGRIRQVEVCTKTPVLTFWDIGMSDETAIWFVQPNGEELRLINYYENTGEGMDHYVEYMKTFATKHGCKYGTVYFPHDGKNQEFIAGTRRHTAMANYGFDVHVIPRTQAVETAIYQTKQLFPRFVFDENRCFQGINCLENYRRKVNAEGTEGSPHHDWSSNGSDALRQIGQFYADKYVSKEHDVDAWNEEHDYMEQQMAHELGDYNEYDDGEW